MKSTSPIPATRDLLLIGGGHSHAIVLRRFAMRPLPGARITLVDPGPVAFYSGMLPGLVSGQYSLDEISIDLVKIARWAGARIILDRVVALDPVAKSARLGSGRSIDYDVVSINTGSTSEAPSIEDPAALLVPVKPLPRFIEAQEAFVEAVKAGRSAPSARVVGAGVGGAELALALKARLTSAGVQDADVALLEKGERALAAMPSAPRRAVLRALEARGVRVRCGVDIRSAEPGDAGVRLVAASGETDDAAIAFVAAGALPPDFVAGSGLETDEAGFIAVDPALQSPSHPGVFAAGDTAAMIETPRAKAGVFAVRQGKTLAHNLEAALRGTAMRRYYAQRTWLKLLNLGDGHAIGEKGGLALDGPSFIQRALWRWKDRIDRRFMAKFDPEPMTPADPPRRATEGVAEAAETGMLCGGCGSKVGDGALRTALAALPAPPTLVHGVEVLQGVGDDAAVLRPEGGRPIVWTTDHFRAFLQDPWLLSRIATIHALGDIRAMGAAPVAALLSLTLEQAAPPLQGRDLSAALDGARSVLDPAGVALAGGHSALGAELGIGLSLLGQPAEGRWIGLDGARPGDVLVLTRPIGVGTVLAGEMALRASGRDVAAVWAMMAEDKAADAAALAPEASAMTDVTGFGLGGHLLSILDASGVDAELALDAIPLVAGAAALAAQGVESSVAPSNRQRLSLALAAEPLGMSHSTFPLLVDPQTAGGFLAAMPKAAARRAVEVLHQQDVPAAVIGRIAVRDGPGPTIRLLS